MICTEYDQWLKDQDKTVWFVELEFLRGDETFVETVYQDDNRPGLEEPKAWLRLKTVIENNDGIKIKKFGLLFRDHVVEIPLDRINGIFFSFAVGGNMLSPHTENYYVLGVIEKNDIYKYWYRIPEIILCDQTKDNITDKNDLRIIWL